MVEDIDSKDIDSEGKKERLVSLRMVENVVFGLL